MDLQYIAKKKKTRPFTVPSLEISRSADDLFRNDCSYLQTGQSPALFLSPHTRPNRFLAHHISSNFQVSWLFVTTRRIQKADFVVDEAAVVRAVTSVASHLRTSLLDPDVHAARGPFL